MLYRLVSIETKQAIKVSVEKLVIGTDHDQCDLRLRNSSLQPVHCELNFTDGRFSMTPTRLLVHPISDSDTRLNGQRIVGQHEVSNGDVLTLSDRSFRIESMVNSDVEPGHSDEELLFSSASVSPSLPASRIHDAREKTTLLTASNIDADSGNSTSFGESQFESDYESESQLSNCSLDDDEWEELFGEPTSHEPARARRVQFHGPSSPTAHRCSQSSGNGYNQSESTHGFLPQSKLALAGQWFMGATWQIAAVPFSSGKAFAATVSMLILWLSSSWWYAELDSDGIREDVMVYVLQIEEMQKRKSDERAWVALAQQISHDREHWLTDLEETASAERPDRQQLLFAVRDDLQAVLTAMPNELRRHPELVTKLRIRLQASPNHPRHENPSPDEAALNMQLLAAR